MRSSDWSSDVCSSDLQALAKSGGVSGEELLHAQTALKSAQSGLAQAKAALAAAQARLATNQALTDNTTVADHPDVRQAAPRLRDAWPDPKSVAEGKGVAVRVALGGHRILKKKN